MRGKDARPIVVIVLVLVALLGQALAPAAQTNTQPSSLIVAIDTRTGIVSAKVSATGEDFQFTLNNPALLGTLKIGKGVYANFQAKQVSLDGLHVAGTIVNVGPPKGLTTPSAPQKAGSVPPQKTPTMLPASPSSPTSGINSACCGITSINGPARLVTAKDNSTSQVFEFSIPNSLSIQNLHDGQPVWANFKARKVSLDGKIGCCDIVSFGGTGKTSTTLGTQAQGEGGTTRPQMAGYAEIDPCAIASADSLKALLQAGIQGYFPIAVDNGGEHIRITHPNVEQVICPHMSIKVHTDFGYSQTRGFPQFQTGGTMELESSLVIDVTFARRGTLGNEVIKASNLVRAAAVLSNPQITSLQVDNIPSWVDLTFVTDCLNGKYSNWGCTDVLHTMSFDVTALVRIYLEQGHNLPVNSQTTLASSQPSIIAADTGKPAPAIATGTGGQSKTETTRALPGGPSAGLKPMGPAVNLPTAPHTGGSSESVGPNPAGPSDEKIEASITRIDLSTRFVEAKDDASARLFEFPVTDTKQILALHAGQPVWANFKTRKVSLDGQDFSCTIVGFSNSSVAVPVSSATVPRSAPSTTGKTSSGQQPPPHSPGSVKMGATLVPRGDALAARNTAQQANSPFGGKSQVTAVVTRVDAQTGLVSAQDRASGRKLHFLLEKLDGASSLAVGTAVYADVARRQVSLDNAHVAGAMVSPLAAKFQGNALAHRFLAGTAAELPSRAMWHPARSTASTSVARSQLYGTPTMVASPAAATSPSGAALSFPKGTINIAPAVGYTFENVDVPSEYGQLNFLFPPSLPYGINDKDEIVGTYMIQTNDWWGFAWDGFLKAAGRYMNILSAPNAISDGALVVGTFPDSNSVFHGYTGFVANLGPQLVPPNLPTKVGPNFTNFRQIDVPGACSDWLAGTFASGVNDGGQVVGSFYDSSCNNLHGFLFSGGSFKQLDFPGASETMPIAISDSGQIVGLYDVFQGLLPGPWQGFLYTNGNYSDIGGGGLLPLGINKLGQIVGAFSNSSGTHCFLEANGSISQIDVPGAGAAGTACYGVNGEGQVVGEYAIYDDPRGYYPTFYGFVGTPPQSNLVCSSKPSPLTAPVARGVMISSGARVYCRLHLGSLRLSPSDVVITTSNPAVAQAVRVEATAGALYPDLNFEVSTQPIPRTLPLTISAAWEGNLISTTITLARSAIVDFKCQSYTCQGPVFLGYLGSLTLQLSAPADPDGLQLQISGSDGYSGQISVAAGSDRAEIWPPVKPVTVETPVVYSVRDPFDGSVRTTNLVTEPPGVNGVIIADTADSILFSVSNVPSTGKQVAVHVWFAADPPPAGLSFQVQYGGAPKIMTGPATITYSPSTGSVLTFPATILPCGANPPCQATVSVGPLGSSFGPSTWRTWTVTVNP